MDDQRKKEWLEQRRKHLSRNPDELAKGIISGDKVALSRGLTLVESTRRDDHEQALEMLDKIRSNPGKSVRIGITGVPGVGKSTFIEAFGQELVENGKKVAVLAIDPSSERSGGSILGDKTRMNNLALMPEVFIRPTASGGSLGGVAKRTRESILLCEAAGYDVIIIETVGVGQSETMVKEMVDFFLLLMLAGAGDELQGIKRGIMEMADALVITKADGENEMNARRARNEYKNAMHLFPPNQNSWIPKAMTCSSYTNTGISEIWDVIETFVNQMTISGYLEKNRLDQEVFWFRETLKEMLIDNFHQTEGISQRVSQIEKSLHSGKGNAFADAKAVMNFYIAQLKDAKN
ncbi:methylmalonyl Co-A mutase-associated GTPase MeaB [Wandonia haliotis]|uniref:Methylmalonyl Co-A mutase-associated GTPase MeaB n=1 Tax=Wandonia haliotis TaxID=574963 RepID=A0ABN1MPI0_9FLAO